MFLSWCVSSAYPIEYPVFEAVLCDVAPLPSFWRACQSTCLQRLWGSTQGKTPVCSQSVSSAEPRQPCFLATQGERAADRAAERARAWHKTAGVPSRLPPQPGAPAGAAAAQELAHVLAQPQLQHRPLRVHHRPGWGPPSCTLSWVRCSGQSKACEAPSEVLRGVACCVSACQSVPVLAASRENQLACMHAEGCGCMCTGLIIGAMYWRLGSRR